MDIAEHIKSTIDSSAPVRFKWDDDDIYRYTYHEDYRLLKRIDGLSIRGNEALAAGCAEWIVWRCSTENRKEDAQARLFLEATWAGIVDWTYINIESKPLSCYKGPLAGTRYGAIALIREGLRIAKGDRHDDPSLMHLWHVAHHVLDEKKKFSDWFDFVLARLKKASPDPRSGSRQGNPVPHEILDPDFDFKPADAPRFLDAFLRSLKPAENPFLHSPRKMRALGFKGTPYTY